jgi:hypothetical protein
MAIYRHSIHTILFHGGVGKKKRIRRKRVLAKNNMLPSVKEIRRNRRKE